MAISIIEKVLGTTNPYTSTYLDGILRLTKSITVISKREAVSYNEGVFKRTGKKVETNDLKDWRYFRHLAGLYHEIDSPMKVISRDTRTEITLTKEVLANHLETRRELTKFGVFYDEVTGKYPEQELLLRTMLTTGKTLDIEEIVRLPNWTIVAWNEDFVETQEEDLIPKLQDRIYKLARKGLITNYALVDDLFMAGLYIVLYNFIIQSIINIRLGNAKTGRAHSYHMLNYFASHHGLDASYDFIDDYQRFFLYKNLLYLNSHAGTNEVMDTVIEKFFTYRRISVTNFELIQNGDIRNSHQADYRYRQLLLNKENIAFNDTRYNLDELSEKEIQILPSNRKEYRFNKGRIDFKQTHSKASREFTKDLEINLTDNTDEVKYKLMDLLLDYWAVTIDTGNNNVFIEFINPVNGMSMELVAKDAFNLYVVATHLRHRIPIDTIPDYWANRVFKDEIPSLDFLMGAVASKEPRVKDMVEYVSTRAPGYRIVNSRREFRDYIEAIYRYELGVWVILSREGNLPIYTDLETSLDNMYRQRVCKNGGERVTEFLSRIGIRDLYNYNEVQFWELLLGLFNTVADGILSRSEVNLLTQRAATDIFNKFKSYSTQLLSEYASSDSLLIGQLTPRMKVTDVRTVEEGVSEIDTPIICSDYWIRDLNSVEITENGKSEHRAKYCERLEIDNEIGTINFESGVLHDVNFEQVVCVSDTSPPYKTLTLKQFNEIYNVFQE